VAWLKRGTVLHQWRGHHTCLLCGDFTGSADLGFDLWQWPEGYAHYVEVHGVKPPPAILAYTIPARL
jgi:hypothetical protein